MSYRLAFGCPNNAVVVKALAEGGINLIHGYCEWWADSSIFSLIQKCEDNGIKALLHIHTCNRPGWQARIDTFKDETGLFGLQIEEPYARGIYPAEAQAFYIYAKEKNPDWKIFCAHADDGWCNVGWVVEGYCDMAGTCIYPCGSDDPARYLTDKLTIISYRNAHRYMYDTWGIEVLPVLQAWHEQVCPDCILVSYQTWESVIDRPLAGASYYTTPGFIGLPCIWNQIKSLNYTYLEAPLKLSGSLTFEKSFSWKIVITKIGKFLYGELSFSSTLPKKITYLISGSLSFSGKLLRKLFCALLSGALNFVGNIATKFVTLKKKTIQGALNFSGALSHNFKLSLTAGISFGRVINLKVKARLSGAISLLGFIFASSTWLAICTKTYTFLEILTWSQFQTYTWCKSVLKVISLSGFLTPIGLLPKKILPSLAGVLSLSGSPFQKVKSVVSGALSSSGTFTEVFIKTLLSGDITFSSIVKRFIKKPLSGALSFLGWTQLTTGNLKYLLRKLIQLIQIKGW